jgi:hypothetical protein
VCDFSPSARSQRATFWALLKACSPPGGKCNDASSSRFLAARQLAGRSRHARSRASGCGASACCCPRPRTMRYIRPAWRCSWGPKVQQRIIYVAPPADGGLAPVYPRGAPNQGSISHGDGQHGLSYRMSAPRRRLGGRKGQRCWLRTILERTSNTAIIPTNAGAAYS